MPSVGHLLRLRRRRAGGRTITRTTVTADDLDLRVLAQPGDHRVALAIGQQIDDLAALEIDHDAPVAVATAPGEVVDADDPRRWRRHGGRVAASQNPKHRVARPRRRQTRHHARTRPAAQSDRHRTHQRIATPHPAAISPANRRRQRLAKRPPWARRVHAPEPSNRQSQPDGAAADRQIRKRSVVSAVQGRRWNCAVRAVRSHRRKAARHFDNSVDHSPAFHDQTLVAAGYCLMLSRPPTCAPC